MFGILSRAENEADFPFLTSFQFHLDLQRGAGIEGNAGFFQKGASAGGSRLGERSIATEEFGAVGRGERASSLLATKATRPSKSVL